MAQISLTIPDAALPRVVDALCAKGGWTSADGARGTFAKQVLAHMLRDEVRAYERREAELAALASVAPITPVDIT